MEKYICPECGYTGKPIIEESNYGSDMDGNRGRKMRTVRCPECDYEKGSFV